MLTCLPTLVPIHRCTQRVTQMHAAVRSVSGVARTCEQNLRRHTAACRREDGEVISTGQGSHCLLLLS